MKIFQKNKKYKLITKSENDKIKVYTIRVLDEDNDFIRFIDRDNKEWTINKEKIMEVSEL